MMYKPFKTFALFGWAIILPLMADAQEKKGHEICIPCEKLSELRLPDVRITQAVTVNSATSHCKVLGVIGREIKFELLLPEYWKGIFVMGGGGGFVGSIQNVARSTVNDGLVTAGTDTGHESVGNSSASWALNNMERQINFGHRAVHLTAEVSKAIIRSYYGADADYSYFIGCSRGGGQAMMEAQRYPADFDGIVAGAPAFNWPSIAAEFVQNTKANFPLKLSEPLLTKEHIALLHNEVLKQFDMIDGVKDNVINDPSLCTFDYDALPKCPGDTAAPGCFTRAQLSAVKQIYNGIDLGNGFSYPGFPFGGENTPGGWLTWITGPNEGFMKSSGYPSMHAYFGIEVFKYLILQDPDWDYTKYDFKGYDREMRYAAAYLDATSTDYSGFRERKGKIIIWHGWNDPALSAFASIGHFNAVKDKDPGAESYMKLYLLPGVLHCGGGDGPSNVDWLRIIRDWVENNNPPDKVVVTKTSGGKPVMTRPVFPYPYRAVYDGSGDPNTESSFEKK